MRRFAVCGALARLSIGLSLGAIGLGALPAGAHEPLSLPQVLQAFDISLEVKLVHAGPAHTTGDTAVIFRGRNAVLRNR